MPLPRSCPTRCFAALALLVLLFGLPRMLVMCTGGGRLHVDFAHPAGCCHCAHAGVRGAPPPARGERTPVAHAHCDHRPFACELAPPPTPAKTPAPPAPALLAVCAWPALACEAEPRTIVHPRATGPPRPGAQVSLRTTTQLLI
jgi:hypothetical protein